jgi:thioredoxin-dependent peroxiredoxin
MSAFTLSSGRAQKAPGLRLNPAWSLLLAITCALLSGRSVLAETPAVGAKAADFTLLTPTGKSVTLSAEREGRPLVLVFLRGFPGYQCPYCVKQVHDFVERASDFKARNTRVLLVYPGPPADLDQHAKEFLEKQADLPPNVVLVSDPDYKVTNLYGLRWDAPHETAYPSTFILDGGGTVVFEKVSHSHGDRLSAQDALDQIAAQDRKIESHP